MTRNCVEQGRAGKAEDRSDEEEEKDQFVADVDVVVAVVAKWFDVKDDGGDDEGNKSYQVRPNVSGFGVNPKDRAEAFGERGKLRPVTKMKIVVISERN